MLAGLVVDVSSGTQVLTVMVHNRTGSHNPSSRMSTGVAVNIFRLTQVLAATLCIRTGSWLAHGQRYFCHANNFITDASLIFSDESINQPLPVFHHMGSRDPDIHFPDKWHPM